MPFLFFFFIFSLKHYYLRFSVVADVQRRSADSSANYLQLFWARTDENDLGASSSVQAILSRGKTCVLFYSKQDVFELLSDY